MDTAQQQQATNISALATQLMSEFSEAQRARTMVNERWLEDLRQYRGIYAGDVSKRLPLVTSCQRFATKTAHLLRLTRMGRP